MLTSKRPLISRIPRLRTVSVVGCVVVKVLAREDTQLVTEHWGPGTVCSQITSVIQVDGAQNTCPTPCCY